MNTVNNNLAASSSTASTSFKKKTNGVGGSLGFKNVLILFFSAMAVSLVVLVIFFGLFFQKVDFSLNTKPLENAPTIIDPEAPVPDETENAPLSENQLNNVFNEININVPTDAYKMGKQPVEQPTTQPTGTTEKSKSTDAYIGVGASTNTVPAAESATDVQVEEAPPLPKQGGYSKTAPVAQSSGSSKTEEPSSSEPDLMPMAPLPGQ